MPPFTQHGDAPQHDGGGHGYHPEPGYDKATGFSQAVETGVHGGNKDEISGI